MNIPTPSKLRILYLDFDGVLHPDEVYMAYGKVELRVQGRLFENAQWLDETLNNFPNIQIVLSTNWMPIFRSYSRVKKYLPKNLQKKIIGSFWHTSFCNRYETNYWIDNGKYLNIMRDVITRRPYAWLAVDDDVDDWLEKDNHHLIKIPGHLGLKTEKTRKKFITSLEKLNKGDELKNKLLAQSNGFKKY